MQELRQSTEITFRIGPFLNETDGKTAETGLTITQADIRLSKAGGDFAQKNASQTLTHDEAGWYILTLNTTDTNTLGMLDVFIHESGALPVWRHFMVLPANVYDSLIGGTDKLDINVAEISDDAGAANNLESYCDGTTPQPVNATHISGDSTAADNLESYCDGGANMPVDTIKISGDYTAADNAEAMFDGTGYAGGTIKLKVDARRFV